MPSDLCTGVLMYTSASLLPVYTCIYIHIHSSYLCQSFFGLLFVVVNRRESLIIYRVDCMLNDRLCDCVAVEV